MKENLCADLPPVYLRLSVTDRCNFRCQYCRPASRAQPAKGCAPASDAELLGLLGLFQQACSIYKLRLTGGEPLLRPGLVRLVRRLRRDIPHTQLCMTTNAVLLRHAADSLYRAGLQRMNISLDTTDAATFRTLTRGGRAATTIDGIRAAREAGFRQIKINTVLMRRFNGGCLADLVRLAADHDCEIRFIELMPCGEGSHLYPTEYLPSAEALERLTRTFDYLGPAPSSATAERHRLLVGGSETVVGFIPAVSRPFCQRCDRLRLDCRGRLFSCLRGERAIDLLTPWRAGRPEVVRERIRDEIAAKCPPNGLWPDRPMATIGG